MTGIKFYVWDYDSFLHVKDGKFFLCGEFRWDYFHYET